MEGYTFGLLMLGLFGGIASFQDLRRYEVDGVLLTYAGIIAIITAIVGGMVVSPELAVVFIIIGIMELKEYWKTADTVFALSFMVVLLHPLFFIFMAFATFTVCRLFWEEKQVAFVPFLTVGFAGALLLPIVSQFLLISV